MSSYYSRDQKYQKGDFAPVAGYFLNPFLSSDLVLMHCSSMPASALILPFFYYFTFLSPRLTWNTRLCAFPLFFSLFYASVAPSGHTIGEGDLAGTHRDISAWLLPDQQADCAPVCVSECVCLLMCSVTLPLCLPATFCLHSPIPEGHSHTERHKHTHRSNLPVTFHILLTESWFLFFVLLFDNTKPGYIILPKISVLTLLCTGSLTFLSPF